MSAIVTVQEARAILGDDVLGPEEVTQVFGVGPAIPPLPFCRDDLGYARSSGEMLVLRLAEVDARPLTLAQMLTRFPNAFDQKLLRQVGYQLKDDWGITLEPRAQTDRCTTGWALVRKEILEDSRNRPYDEQETVIRCYAEARKGSAPVRRRTIAEAVYDALLYFSVRQVRLLANTWDWSSSPTLDGGYLTVGGFGTSGMQIVAFSRGIRHGALGVCPTRQPN